MYRQSWKIYTNSVLALHLRHAREDFINSWQKSPDCRLGHRLANDVLIRKTESSDHTKWLSECIFIEEQLHNCQLPWSSTMSMISTVSQWSCFDRANVRSCPRHFHSVLSSIRRPIRQEVHQRQPTGQQSAARQQSVPATAAVTDSSELPGSLDRLDERSLATAKTQQHHFPFNSHRATPCNNGS